MNCYEARIASAFILKPEALSFVKRSVQQQVQRWMGGIVNISQWEGKCLIVWTTVAHQVGQTCTDNTKSQMEFVNEYSCSLSHSFGPCGAAVGLLAESTTATETCEPCIVAKQQYMLVHDNTCKHRGGFLASHRAQGSQQSSRHSLPAKCTPYIKRRFA